VSKVWKSEKDIRKAIRDQKSFADRTFWIEPNLGSTDGLPDCFVLMGWEKLAWLELKLGAIDKGHLLFKVRSAQRDVMLSLSGKGQRCYILAGEENGTRLWLLPCERAVLNGRVELEDYREYQCIPEGLWRILYRKFFSDLNFYRESKASV
jgi:hypothetical protein